MLASTTLTNNTAHVFTELTDGGPTYFQIPGTFGGSTINIDASFDGGTSWTNVIALTAPGIRVVDLPRCTIRAQAVGGSGINTPVIVR